MQSWMMLNMKSCSYNSHDCPLLKPIIVLLNFVPGCGVSVLRSSARARSAPGTVLTAPPGAPPPPTPPPIPEGAEAVAEAMAPPGGPASPLGMPGNCVGKEAGDSDRYIFQVLGTNLGTLETVYKVTVHKVIHL